MVPWLVATLFNWPRSFIITVVTVASTPRLGPNLRALALLLLAVPLLLWPVATAVASCMFVLGVGFFWPLWATVGLGSLLEGRLLVTTAVLEPLDLARTCAVEVWRFNSVVYFRYLDELRRPYFGEPLDVSIFRLLISLVLSLLCSIVSSLAVLALGLLRLPFIVARVLGEWMGFPSKWPKPMFLWLPLWVLGIPIIPAAVILLFLLVVFGIFVYLGPTCGVVAYIATSNSPTHRAFSRALFTALDVMYAHIYAMDEAAVRLSGLGTSSLLPVPSQRVGGRRVRYVGAAARATQPDPDQEPQPPGLATPQDRAWATFEDLCDASVKQLLCWGWVPRADLADSEAYLFIGLPALALLQLIADAASAPANWMPAARDGAGAEADAAAAAGGGAGEGEDLAAGGEQPDAGKDVTVSGQAVREDVTAAVPEAPPMTTAAEVVAAVGPGEPTPAPAPDRAAADAEALAAMVTADSDQHRRRCSVTSDAGSVIVQDEFPPGNGSMIIHDDDPIVGGLPWREADTGGPLDTVSSLSHVPRAGPALSAGALTPDPSVGNRADRDGPSRPGLDPGILCGRNLSSVASTTAVSLPMPPPPPSPAALELAAFVRQSGQLDLSQQVPLSAATEPHHGVRPRPDGRDQQPRQLEGVEQPGIQGGGGPPLPQPPTLLAPAPSKCGDDGEEGIGKRGSDAAGCSSDRVATTERDVTLIIQGGQPERHREHHRTRPSALEPVRSADIDEEGSPAGMPSPSLVAPQAPASLVTLTPPAAAANAAQASQAAASKPAADAAGCVALPLSPEPLPSTLAHQLLEELAEHVLTSDIGFSSAANPVRLERGLAALQASPLELRYMACHTVLLGDPRVSELVPLGVTTRASLHAGHPSAPGHKGHTPSTGAAAAAANGAATGHPGGRRSLNGAVGSNAAGSRPASGAVTPVLGSHVGGGGVRPDSAGLRLFGLFGRDGPPPGGGGGVAAGGGGAGRAVASSGGLASAPNSPPLAPLSRDGPAAVAVAIAAGPPPSPLPPPAAAAAPSPLPPRPVPRGRLSLNGGGAGSEGLATGPSVWGRLSAVLVPQTAVPAAVLPVSDNNTATVATTTAAGSTPAPAGTSAGLVEGSGGPTSDGDTASVPPPVPAPAEPDVQRDIAAAEAPPAPTGPAAGGPAVPPAHATSLFYALVGRRGRSSARPPPQALDAPAASAAATVAAASAVPSGTVTVGPSRLRSHVRFASGGDPTAAAGAASGLASLQDVVPSQPAAPVGPASDQLAAPTQPPLPPPPPAPQIGHRWPFGKGHRRTRSQPVGVPAGGALFAVPPHGAQLVPPSPRSVPGEQRGAISAAVALFAMLPYQRISEVGVASTEGNTYAVSLAAADLEGDPAAAGGGGGGAAAGAMGTGADGTLMVSAQRLAQLHAFTAAVQSVATALSKKPKMKEIMSRLLVKYGSCGSTCDEELSQLS